MYTIRKVTIAKIHETSPDLSYYEPGADEGPEVAAQCKARLDDYDRQEWYVMGLRAEVELLHLADPADKSGTLHTLSSGGLWGVESDSGEEYLREVAGEELADLKTLCLDLAGVTAEAFDAAAAEALADEWDYRVEGDFAAKFTHVDLLPA